MDNGTIAHYFNEIGTLLEIKGENPFKARAYFNAARLIESTSQDINVLVAEDRLKELNGIGEGLQEKITTLVKTGDLPYYEELKSSLPAGLLEFLRIPGLGPKKIKVLYEQLNVTDIQTLRKVCEDGQVSALKGFGEKTAKNILAGIEQILTYESKYRYGDVILLAEEIVETLRIHPDVIRISLAGSLRRSKEIVKDIDILVSAKDSTNIMDAFCNMPEVKKVQNHGETKSSVLLQNGMQCDLRVVQDHQFPYALHHFTGSKEHNVAMRQLAIGKGWKMSEWGLFDGDKLIPCVDETSVFQQFGLDFIPPELRENLGEIETARNHTLPRLVEWTELRGCFHNHTTESDGRSSLEEMAAAAEEMGLEYLGIADHSKSSYQANGLSEERLLKQIEEIRAYNHKKHECYLFSGVECDILKDGELDFSDDILSQLDYVVASVHSNFNLPEKEMTARIIRAIENPYITMLGHVTGRLLLQRESYAVNLPKIIDAAAETGTWIELNANIKRLDMDWRFWKLARDKGVKCVINPDAHHTSQLGFLKLGIQIARKGWLRKQDVVNAETLSQVKKDLLLKRKKFSKA